MNCPYTFLKVPKSSCSGSGLIAKKMTLRTTDVALSWLKCLLRDYFENDVVSLYANFDFTKNRFCFNNYLEKNIRCQVCLFKQHQWKFCLKWLRFVECCYSVDPNGYTVNAFFSKIRQRSLCKASVTIDLKIYFVQLFCV